MMKDMLRFSAVFASFALAACSGSSGGHGSYGSGDPNLAAPNPGGGQISPFLTNGQAVLAALDAIEQRSGKPLRVTSLTSDGMNGLMVNVQEPNNHINVDEYAIAPDGTMKGPTPVKLMSLNGGPITATTVDAEAFDPHAIAWAHLTQTARDAIARSKYADARVTQWEIDGIGPSDRRYIYMESARARPAAAVNDKLAIVDMSF